MVTFSDWYACLRNEGYLTLQVPDFNIGPADRVEVPDEWLCYLKHNGRPAVGREEGCLYISRVGFEANRDQIVEAFVGGASQRYPDDSPAELAERFEAYAQSHFQSVDEQLERALQDARSRMQDSGGPYWTRKVRALECFTT